MKKTVIPFIILFILIFLCSSVWYFKYSNIEIIKDEKVLEEDIKELEWDFISSIIYEDYLAAQGQSKSIATHITDDIMTAYPDIEKMKFEVDHPDIVEEPNYLKIMKQNITGKFLHGISNDENDMLICIRDGIICDLSLKDTYYEFPHSWETVYSKSLNPKLSKNAVELIFKKSTKMIYWEIRKMENNIDQLPLLGDYPSMMELKKAFMHHGLNVMKNVVFLAPAYITANGDIFGIEDVDIYGNKVHNYKIVVIQTFNPYDQLTVRHNTELNKFNLFKEKILMDFKLSQFKQSLLLTYIVLLTVILVFFMMKYNNKMLKK